MDSSPTTPSPQVPPEIRAAILARVEQGLIDLPLLPQVAQDVIAETDRPEGDPRRLAELIRHDAAMAGHVLRIANSALFQTPSPIVSLQQAISRLGMLSIRRIALLIACQTRVFRVAGYDVAVVQMFQHSLAAAAFCQEIARLRRSNVEEAFLCGLLHDVGRPVVLQALSDLGTGEAYGRPAAPIGQLPVEPAVAHALADELHARVGSVLTTRWALPPWLAEVIAHHHDPLRAPTCAIITSITAVADTLSHLTLGSRDVDEGACRDHPLWGQLNIYPDQVDKLLRRRGAITEMVQTLS